jgi:hypothetical protein
LTPLALGGVVGIAGVAITRGTRAVTEPAISRLDVVSIVSLPRICRQRMGRGDLGPNRIDRDRRTDRGLRSRVVMSRW